MPGTRIEHPATTPIEPSQARSVALIDDHPVVALGLRLALRGSSRFTLAHVATGPAQAFSGIERLRPDVVIADLVYDGVVRVDLIAECRRLLPHAVVLAFSSLPVRMYERVLIEAGANRHVPKDQPIEALIAVMNELTSRPSGAKSEFRARGHSGHYESTLEGVHLTRRELEVGHRLSLGWSAVRIGEELGLSPNTVAVHRDNIRKKLSCRDSAELISRLARLYPSHDRHA